MDEAHDHGCGYYARDGCTCDYHTMKARIKELEEERARWQKALRRIAEEPIGGPEATHREVLEGCVGIARRALAGKEPKRPCCCCCSAWQRCSWSPRLWR